MTKVELTRLDRIGEIEVRDVSPELLPAYLDFFDHRAFLDFPEWRSCYCIETHSPVNLSDDESVQRVAEANRRGMSSLISRNMARPSSGLVSGQSGCST